MHSLVPPTRRSVSLASGRGHSTLQWQALIMAVLASRTSSLPHAQLCLGQISRLRRVVRAIGWKRTAVSLDDLCEMISRPS
jgi:hypothetical protein